MVTATNLFEIELQDATVVITATGDLRELNYPKIEAAAREVLQFLEETQARRVVVDLHHCNYYGSTALGFFLQLWKRTEQRDGRVAFCGISPHDMEVLRVARLDQKWMICESRDEALRAVVECNKITDTIPSGSLTWI